MAGKAPQGAAPPQELLIVSVTPQNLERDVLWYAENQESIKKARMANPWWREHAFFVEQDLVMKPAELARRLSGFSYERVQTVRSRGLFAVRGGVIEIWPINTAVPYLIEFSGNTIASLVQRPPTEELPHAKPRISQKTTMENLAPGSFVVHIDHGIGIFHGMGTDARQKNILGTDIPTDDFFIIEYAPPREGAEPDRLFVPRVQYERLSPYVGFELPRVHRLGGSLWMNTKRKVKEETEKLARALLALYAKRSLARRPPRTGDNDMEARLRESFPYQETEDQSRAENEILADMARDAPMDRVLCGDVGFGKTEVAIRAAMRIIASGAQVAVLAPTTVLAAQHERTFRERFAALPVSVRMISRLASPAEQTRMLDEVQNGKIDCIIGTHRLLSRDVAFKNLGMVILDEEQRFGVKQKERLKEICADVDILSLSATPIPRTMQLTLARLRDISTLDTPPPGRLAIQTLVLPYSAKLIAEAILRERERGGQVYFLHNRIETIGAVKQKLERMLAKKAKLGFTRFVRHSEPPGAERNPVNLRDPSSRRVGTLDDGIRVKPRIAIMHGRMGEDAIIRTMNEFREGKIDILLATTIIENGLDISSANTLIVDDATRLGLAQAHQLRGRIGRGTDQAYAYFLYRPKHLTQKATERLEALQEYAELGAGYQLALRDLEIRGAGNILGRKQSGAINKIGLNLYYQMLGEAVEEARNESALL
ncbi:MAG: helicase-related protein [bacterium]|nr:helicase-related protein [bacterium]MDZ4299383.1 helicase-related protein [Candidatus Sungbacteria bacterium]